MISTTSEGWPWYAKLAMVLLAVTLIIHGMIVAKAILVPFLFALFFAILLSPVCGKLESWKIPRLFSAILSLLGGILLIFGVGFFFYSQLLSFAQDFDQIQSRLNSLFDDVNEFLSPWVEDEPLVVVDNIQDTVISYIGDNFDGLTRGVIDAASTLTLIFIIPVYVVLLLIFRDFLKEFIIRAASSDHTETVKRLVNKVKAVVQNYILGMLIVIVILAVLNSIVLLSLGINHAIFFAVFAAMLNVIPFIGPLIGSILPILYALLTTDSLIFPIVILLSFYIIQLFESNLFTPAIVGRKVSLNPLVTLMAIFIGAQIWGLVGMILFIPTGAVLKVVFDEVDSMKPYGFLLGKASNYESGSKSALAEKVRTISKKFEGENKEEEDDADVGKRSDTKK